MKLSNDVMKQFTDLIIEVARDEGKKMALDQTFMFINDVGEVFMADSASNTIESFDAKTGKWKKGFNVTLNARPDGAEPTEAFDSVSIDIDDADVAVGFFMSLSQDMSDVGVIVDGETING